MSASDGTCSFKCSLYATRAFVCFTLHALFYVSYFYVNDMKISISLESKLFLYADNSAILFSHKDTEVISRKLGSELEFCSKWLIDNKLSLHTRKTECMLFDSKRKLRKVNDFSIEYN